jgi:hypothetical protein
MSNEKTVSPTKVVTDEVRFSYLNAFVPRKAPGSDKEKYSVCILCPKTNKALKKRLDNAVQAAIVQGKESKWGGKLPPNLKMPIRDGDLERPDDPNYAGMWFVNCSSDQKPGIVDSDGRTPIINATDIYSGCYGKASLNFFPFMASGNKGVACGLNNLMKTKDGEALAGRASAESDFGGEDNDDL